MATKIPRKQVGIPEPERDLLDRVKAHQERKLGLRLTLSSLITRMIRSFAKQEGVK